jgi:hypothetical protein
MYIKSFIFYLFSNFRLLFKTSSPIINFRSVLFSPYRLFSYFYSLNLTIAVSLFVSTSFLVINNQNPQISSLMNQLRIMKLPIMSEILQVCTCDCGELFRWKTKFTFSAIFFFYYRREVAKLCCCWLQSYTIFQAHIISLIKLCSNTRKLFPPTSLFYSHYNATLVTDGRMA